MISQYIQKKYGTQNKLLGTLTKPVLQSKELEKKNNRSHTNSQASAKGLTSSFDFSQKSARSSNEYYSRQNGKTLHPPDPVDQFQQKCTKPKNRVRSKSPVAQMEISPKLNTTIQNISTAQTVVSAFDSAPNKNKNTPPSRNHKIKHAHTDIPPNVFNSISISKLDHVEKPRRLEDQGIVSLNGQIPQSPTPYELPKKEKNHQIKIAPGTTPLQIQSHLNELEKKASLKKPKNKRNEFSKTSKIDEKYIGNLKNQDLRIYEKSNTQLSNETASFGRRGGSISGGSETGENKFSYTNYQTVSNHNPPKKQTKNMSKPFQNPDTFGKTNSNTKKEKNKILNHKTMTEESKKGNERFNSYQDIASMKKKEKMIGEDKFERDIHKNTGNKEKLAYYNAISSHPEEKYSMKYKKNKHNQPPLQEIFDKNENTYRKEMVNSMSLQKVRKDNRSSSPNRSNSKSPKQKKRMDFSINSPRSPESGNSPKKQVNHPFQKRDLTPDQAFKKFMQYIDDEDLLLLSPQLQNYKLYQAEGHSREKEKHFTPNKNLDVNAFFEIQEEAASFIQHWYRKQAKRRPTSKITKLKKTMASSPAKRTMVDKRIGTDKIPIFELLKYSDSFRNFMYTIYTGYKELHPSKEDSGKLTWEEFKKNILP